MRPHDEVDQASTRHAVDAVDAGTQIVGRRTAVAIGGAVLLANASNYAFQIVAGRRLSVEEYGLLGGFLAIVTVITVSTSALQTIAARAMAAGEAVPPTRRIDGLTRTALIGAGAVTVAGIALSPLLTRALDVGVIPVLVLAAYVAPSALDSIAAGRLQGARRFTGLAAYSALQAVTKLTLSVLVLLIGAGIAGLLGMIVVGSGLVASCALFRTRHEGAVNTHVLGAEARRSFAAVALFWVILTIDVPLARANFDETDAGIYAAAAVLGKAVLWLPTMVAQLVFPSLATAGAVGASASALLRRAAQVVLVIAVASVAALALLGDPVYRVLYGERYERASEIAWRIGVAVIPLAIVNLLMFQLLARRDGRFLKWFVFWTIVHVALLLVVPRTGNWYAMCLGLVGTGLLITMLLAARRADPSGAFTTTPAAVATVHP
jgi:O-antigen/teichoic acid export membrane protein